MIALSLEIANKFDEIYENKETSSYIEKKIDCSCKNRNKMLGIIDFFNRHMQIIENKFEIYKSSSADSSNDKKICKLDVLKLQLELSKQKGFYLMFKEKSKIVVQEDLLIVFAQVVQELNKKRDFVVNVMHLLKGLKEFSQLDYVTNMEEQIIASCYSLLYEELLNISLICE
ncbi:MAG: hypothetical protein IJY55_03840 [Clostridia bacterium]|nr:hypothetical protein [Clostridia bacterium]